MFLTSNNPKNKLKTKRCENYNCTIFFTENKLPPGFPTIAPPSSTMVVEVGHTATLPCQASGNPTPKIRWLWNSLPLDVASNPRYALLNDKMHGKWYNLIFLKHANQYRPLLVSCVSRNEPKLFTLNFRCQTNHLLLSYIVNMYINISRTFRDIVP